MERNSDNPIASSDAEAAPESQLPPGPVVKRESRGGIWLFVALVVTAVLIYLAKGMM